jgi:hypothetical protein
MMHLKKTTTASDTTSHSAPQPATSDKQTSQKGGETQSVTARHGATELDIFEHPYVSCP